MPGLQKLPKVNLIWNTGQEYALYLKVLPKLLTQHVFQVGVLQLYYFSAAFFVFTSYAQCRMDLISAVSFFPKFIPIKKVNLDSCFFDCAQICSCLLQVDCSVNNMLCLILSKDFENWIQSSRNVFIRQNNKNTEKVILLASIDCYQVGFQWKKLFVYCSVIYFE